MPTFVTFYGYAFAGAPRRLRPASSRHRGWFAAPGVEHLIATRARTALGRAINDRIAIFRCSGRLEGALLAGDPAEMSCDEAELMFEGSVADSLWWFTLYCARSVITRWEAPGLVREFLKAGSPSLRQVAHKCAWGASLALDGVPRLAARVAMYAASDDRPTHAARESCRLAGQIAGDRLHLVATHQERALASALLSSISSRPSEQTLGEIPEMRPTPQWGRDLAA